MSATSSARSSSMSSPAKNRQRNWHPWPVTLVPASRPRADVCQQMLLQHVRRVCHREAVQQLGAGRDGDQTGYFRSIFQEWLPDCRGRQLRGLPGTDYVCVWQSPQV